MLSLFVRRRRVWVRALPPATTGVRWSRSAGWRAPRPRAATASPTRSAELAEQLGHDAATAATRRGAAVTSESAGPAQQQPALLRDGGLHRRDVLLRRRARVRAAPRAPAGRGAAADGRRWPTSAPRPAYDVPRRRPPDPTTPAQRRRGARRPGRPASRSSLTVLGVRCCTSASVVTRGLSAGGRRGATCSSSRRPARWR